MKIEQIIKFLGWRKGCVSTEVHPDHYECGLCCWVAGEGRDMKSVAPRWMNPINWITWMTYVEPRIREKGLWDTYISMLCGRLNSIFPEVVMEATLPQRAEALMRVLEDGE